MSASTWLSLLLVWGAPSLAAAGSSVSAYQRVPPKAGPAVPSWSMSARGWRPDWVEEVVTAELARAGKAPSSGVLDTAAGSWPTLGEPAGASAVVEVSVDKGEPVFYQDKKEVRGGSRPVYEVQNCVKVQLSVSVALTLQPTGEGSSAAYRDTDKGSSTVKKCSKDELRDFRAKYAKGPPTKTEAEKLVRAGVLDVLGPVLPTWSKRQLALMESEEVAPGIALARTGDYTGALASWAGLGDASLAGRTNQGVVCELLGRLDEAEAHYSAATALGGTEAEFASIREASERVSGRRAELESLQSIGIKPATLGQ